MCGGHKKSLSIFIPIGREKVRYFLACPTCLDSRESSTAQFGECEVPLESSRDVERTGLKKRAISCRELAVVIVAIDGVWESRQSPIRMVKGLWVEFGVETCGNRNLRVC